jgi:endogenous inhibitor of DNA gyrase (YacG/DUF329 family)
VYCRRAPAHHAWRPFCSERCQLADLGRWLSGDYRLPDDPAAADAADPDSLDRPDGDDN